MKETIAKELGHLSGPMRVPFLILTPSCVLLGLGVAVWTSGEVIALQFVLVLIGAVCAHISVNSLNEYFDFRSGLDYMTARTPFSGGSGALPQNPELARHALIMGLITSVISALIGAYFLHVRGLLLMPLGILGLLVIFAYTSWFTRTPFLCLIAPGLGFGPLMVIGTAFALAGTYSWTAFFASLVPFFLVSDLLLLNQFPDVEADQRVGRRHFPIVVGRQASSYIYGLFLLLAYLSIVLGVCYGYLPRFSLVGLITLVLAVPAFVGARKHATDTGKLIPYMGFNVILVIATPVLVAAGLFIG